MNIELIDAAKELLNYMADVNGNVYSEFSDRLSFNSKKKFNRLVKNLHNQINKTCPTISNSSQPNSL